MLVCAHSAGGQGWGRGAFLKAVTLGEPRLEMENYSQEGGCVEGATEVRVPLRVGTRGRDKLRGTREMIKLPVSSHFISGAPSNAELGRQWALALYPIPGPLALTPS